MNFLITYQVDLLPYRRLRSDLDSLKLEVLSQGAFMNSWINNLYSYNLPVRLIRYGVDLGPMLLQFGVIVMIFDILDRVAQVLHRVLEELLVGYRSQSARKLLLKLNFLLQRLNALVPLLVL